MFGDGGSYAVVSLGCTLSLFLAQVAGTFPRESLLMVAGLYVAWYGWYGIDRFGDEDPFVDRVTGWSSDTAAWVDDRGGTTVGLVLAVTVACAAVFVEGARARRAR